MLICICKSENREFMDRHYLVLRKGTRRFRTSALQRREPSCSRSSELRQKNVLLLSLSKGVSLIGFAIVFYLFIFLKSYDRSYIERLPGENVPKEFSLCTKGSNKNMESVLRFSHCYFSNCNKQERECPHW